MRLLKRRGLYKFTVSVPYSIESKAVGRLVDSEEADRLTAP